jgi:hypothetical protein
MESLASQAQAAPLLKSPLKMLDIAFHDDNRNIMRGK